MPAKPLLKLKDFHAERKALMRAFRKTRQTRLQTTDGRTVSLIRWNAKTKRYEDHRNNFSFELRNSWLDIFRLKSNDKKEKEPYSRCIIRKAFPNSTKKQDILDQREIRGSIVFVTMVGYTDTLRKMVHRQPGHSHRGIMPAIIDYLQRHGATKIILNTSNEKLKQYYADLGFKKDDAIGMLSLTLK